MTDGARSAEADLAALVRERPPVGAVRLVTVDGFSGAGKSRLTNRLARQLGRAPSVHLDFFYPGWDGLGAGVALAVDWVAAPLRAGRPARWRRFDWDAGSFAEWHETPWAPIVVLEGGGAGSAALQPFTATAIWVDTPAALREQRLRARRDWPRYAPHRDRWAAQEQAHFAAERPWERADARVDGGDGGNCRSGVRVTAVRPDSVVGRPGGENLIRLRGGAAHTARQRWQALQAGVGPSRREERTIDTSLRAGQR